MKILSNRAVLDAEKKALDEGTCTSLELMERVVERMWSALQRAPETRDMNPSRIVVFAGKGRNAGDAIGLASKFRGRHVTLYTAEGLGSLCREASTQLGRIPMGGYSVGKPEPGSDLLIIDGLLGAGAHGTLKPEYSRMVRELNELRERSPRSFTVAIDSPTGLNVETGMIDDVAVRADLTLPIGAVRPGLLQDAAADYVGGLLCIPLPGVDIAEVSDDGSGSCSGSRFRVLDEETVQGWLKMRAHSSHKYQVGSVTVIAGSKGMVGAAQMCAEAALAAGSGLVTLYCPADVYPILAARVEPEVMVYPLREEMAAADITSRGGVLVMGPGMGDEFPANLYPLLKKVVGTWPSDGCVVLDAGGLVTAFGQGWELPDRIILTPHPGEMRKIFPLAGAIGQRKRIVEDFVAGHVCTLVLKGARTIISDKSESYYNSSGGPWMAGPGFGDILAGAIGALVAQGLPPVRAAALGAFACGQAATDAWRVAGFPPSVRATSTLTYLPGRLV